MSHMQTRLSLKIKCNVPAWMSTFPSVASLLVSCLRCGNKLDLTPAKCFHLAKVLAIDP